MRLLRFLQTSTASSTFRKTVLAVAILAFPWTGHCEDGKPVFTHLELGETASFAGYLLSPEAVGEVVTVDDERRLRELAAKDLAFGEERAGLTRQIKERDARIDRLNGEASVVADARAKERIAYESEIKRLRSRVLLFAIGGALCGGAAVGVATLL